MILKPSIEEYIELGKELCFLCARIESLSCRIGQELGVSKSQYKHIRETIEMISSRIEGETLHP